MNQSLYKTIHLSKILLIFLLCSCTNDIENSKITLDLDSSGDISYQKTEINLSIGCSGDWKLTTNFESTGENWCTLSKTSGSGDEKVAINIDANEWQRTRSVEIELKSGNSSKNITINQLSWQDYTQSEATKVDIMQQRPLWMELPAIKDHENSAVVSHDTYIDNELVRNFTMMYDTVNYIAHWVAYPMHSIYIGIQSRTDDWAYDPKIPKKYQPKLTSSFVDEDYDRGHIVASAMRTANYQTNAQTFYYSNMTAQQAYLNRYYVSSLETKIRTWATEVDSLFVVTGVILSGDYTLDIEGKNIAVPGEYYYGLLAYEGSEARCIGFLFENTKLTTSDNPLSNYACSISDLEAKSGFEFFTYLDDVSAKESYKTSSWDL